jgi:hypothetical protein
MDRGVTELGEACAPAYFLSDKEKTVMSRVSKPLMAVVVCLVLVSSALAGCVAVEDTIKERPKTAAGAAAGVAGGALIGGLAFQSVTGAVVGGLIGGLAGGLVGNALEVKKEDYRGTVDDYNYTSSQGTVIRIEDTEVEPGRVRSGERVNLVTHYALLTPSPDQPVKVTERWKITRGGQVVGTPVLTVQRQAGTWASAIPITLPSSAQAGEYSVAVTVEAAGAHDSEATTFTVR